MFLPRHPGFQREGGEGDEDEQHRAGECRGGLVVLIQQFDVERQGVGFATDVAGDDGDRAKFAHRARVGQRHAVNQRPEDGRQGDAPPQLPTAGAEDDRRFFFRRAVLLHEGDEFARDERASHENGDEDDARHGEHQLQVVRGEPCAERAVRAVKQKIEQTGDDWRDSKGNIEQGNEQRAATEAEAGNEPGEGDAEDDVHRYGNGGNEQGQPEGVAGVHLGEGSGKGRPAFGKRAVEDDGQRQHEKEQHEGEREGNQEASHAFLPKRRRKCPCQRLTSSSRSSEAASMSEAMAAAAGRSNSCRRSKMSSDTTLLT